MKLLAQKELHPGNILQRIIRAVMFVICLELFAYALLSGIMLMIWLF